MGLKYKVANLFLLFIFLFSMTVHAETGFPENNNLDNLHGTSTTKDIVATSEYSSRYLDNKTSVSNQVITSDFAKQKSTNPTQIGSNQSTDKTSVDGSKNSTAPKNQKRKISSKTAGDSAPRVKENSKSLTKFPHTKPKTKPKSTSNDIMQQQEPATTAVPDENSTVAQSQNELSLVDAGNIRGNWIGDGKILLYLGALLITVSVLGVIFTLVPRKKKRTRFY